MNEGKTAILFIHGFMSSREFFESIEKDLEGCGADMYRPSLAGHDGSLEDFCRSDWRRWQNSANGVLRRLAESYDRILIVGHSMGGLIAQRAAIAEPKNVIGVIGIGFPIKISLGPRWIKLNVAASRPKTPGEDPRITAAREMAGVPITTVGQYLQTFPQNMSFLMAAAQSRRELSQLKAPLTVINFEKDEIVAPSVPDFVKSRLPDAEIVMLPNSYHFLFEKDEQDRMVDIIKRYING